MDFELSEEHRMLKELVARFVADALVPLEPNVLERESSGEGAGLTESERKPIPETPENARRLGGDGELEVTLEPTDGSPVSEPSGPVVFRGGLEGSG